VLHGTIRIDGSRPDLHVICIHFGLLGLERRVQVNILCDRIESHVPAGAPLLVAGDFNDWLGRAERRLRKRLGLREVFQQIEGRNARSWPAWMPLLRMDRIYYRGLEARGCERLAQAPWHRLSDHAPLSATFALRNGADG
jgi:endonuclease/exonuclease/phosphatase family metal-dependent hydrolase